METLEHFRDVAGRYALDPALKVVGLQIRQSVRQVELLDRYAAELVVRSLQSGTLDWPPLSEQQREDLAALQRARVICLELLLALVGLGGG